MRHAAATLALTALATLAPAAQAAAPGNDDFAEPETIAVGSLVIGTTAEATREGSEPELGYGEAGGTVWYELRPARTGTISVSACGSSSDHHLGAFSGSSISDLTTLSTGLHDNCPERSGERFGGSGMNFSATAGTGYRIAVGAFEREDEGRFQLVIAEVREYENDDFSSAAPIRRRVVQNNEVATAERGEPRHTGIRATRSLWYRFRAPASGTFQLSTEGSSFDTRVAVYRGGAISSLRRVASNDNASRRTVSSRVRFGARRGVTYRIAVDGKRSRISAGLGDVVLTVSR